MRTRKKEKKRKKERKKDYFIAQQFNRSSFEDLFRSLKKKFCYFSPRSRKSRFSPRN